MKHLKKFNENITGTDCPDPYESSNTIQMKLDIEDIFQDIKDAGFGINVSHWDGWDNKLEKDRSIRISIDTPRGLNNHLIWTSIDPTINPEMIDFRRCYGRNRSGIGGLNITEYVLHLEEYAKSKGYNMNLYKDVVIGSYSREAFDPNGNSWFTSMVVSIFED